MARKFLYLVAIAIFLVFAGLMALRLMPGEIARVAFVPKTEFKAQSVAAPSVYADAAMWFSRPGLQGDPALWLPTDATAAADAPADGGGVVPAAKADVGAVVDQAPPAFALAQAGDATVPAIFFIHPTSYLSRDSWNAPLDDAVANDRARLFLRGMASAFNGVGPIWAPRYRQAAIGAFLARDTATADQAFAAAYADVATAFDQFLAEQPPRRPIILAGHSQGAMHLTRLLRDMVAGQPVARRIVAAYVVGWPVSVETDLPALGLPACEAADDAACVLGWQSFAEPADPSLIIAAYDATTGFDGRSRKGTRMLCVNPLTGTRDGDAAAAANLGTLVPDAAFSTATVEKGQVPARCDDDRGFLLVGDPPKVGGYQLPGNNFHVYDYPLFWANVREDAARRLAGWRASR